MADVTLFGENLLLDNIYLDSPSLSTTSPVSLSASPLDLNTTLSSDSQITGLINPSDGLEDNYRFKIGLEGQMIPFHPGFESLTFESKRPVETCMSLRKVLTSDLVVQEGFEYDWLVAIKNSNQNREEIKIEIEELVNGSYVNSYNAYTTIANCRFNESRRTITIKHEPDDEYRGILEGYNDDINFLDAPQNGSDPIINFNVFQFSDPASGGHESYLEFRTTQSSNNQPDNSLALGPIDSEEGDYSDVTIYAVEKLTIDTTNIDTVNDSLTGWTKMSDLFYERPPQIEIFTSDLKIIRSSNIGSHSGYTEVHTWFDGSVGGGTNFSLIWDLHQHKPASTIPNTRKLTDVFKYIVGQLDSNIEPTLASDVSDFFSEATNYIGGVSNLYSDVRIAQITDVKSPTATTSANDGTIKFKQLLEDLHELGFYWFINSSGKFQFEHYHYFDTLAGTNDITLSKYEDYTAWMNSYEYTKEEIPTREIFRVTNGSRHTDSGNFYEVELEYNTLDRRNENDGEEEIHELRTIAFDIRDIWRNPKAYQDSLSVLIAVDGSNNIHRAEYVTGSTRYRNLNYPFDLDKMLGLNEFGVSTGVSIIPFLQYGRYGVNATMGKYSSFTIGQSGFPIVNQSLVRRKKQVELSIPDFKDVTFDYLGNWITEVSSLGRIETAIKEGVSGMISLNIIHPEESGTELPNYPIVPVYPTDLSEANLCDDGNIQYYALVANQGYIIVTQDGDFINVGVVP